MKQRSCRARGQSGGHCDPEQERNANLPRSVRATSGAKSMHDGPHFRKIISFNLKKCPGCDQMFVNHCQSSFEYVVHVIEECDKYKELDLITECRECNFKFPTQRVYNQHESNSHSSKPDWMPASTFRRRNTKGAMESVPCRGCNQELKKIKKGVYRVSDYIHMIEECDGYKKLGRIKTCNNCKCKFINSIGFSHHKC